MTDPCLRHGVMKPSHRLDLARRGFLAKTVTGCLVKTVTDCFGEDQSPLGQYYRIQAPTI